MNERSFWMLAVAIITILALYGLSKANIQLEDSNKCLEEAWQCMERQSDLLKDYREALSLKQIQLNENIAIAASLSLEPLGEFTVTHYSYNSGLTKSETMVRENRTVAVDPDIIPLGSFLYIEGYGWRIAEDTGGLVKGNKLDIYISDHDKAMEMGVKEAKVWIVAEGK